MAYSEEVKTLSAHDFSVEQFRRIIDSFGETCISNVESHSLDVLANALNVLDNLKDDSFFVFRELHLDVVEWLFVRPVVHQLIEIIVQSL
jgi:hypothetical protein